MKQWGFAAAGRDVFGRLNVAVPQQQGVIEIIYCGGNVAGAGAPSLTAMGRCSSLGDSGVSSAWPRTMQVGTPASADTVLWPASQVIIPGCGWLTTRVRTSAAGR